MEERENREGRVMGGGRRKSENGSSKRVVSGRLKKWQLRNNAQFSHV